METNMEYNHFINKDNILLLKEVADSWLGTPFISHCNKKGLGVDCVNLMVEIFKEMGHPLVDIKIPKVSMSQGKLQSATSLSPLVLFLKDLSDKNILYSHKNDPVPGDIIPIKQFNAPHHLALMIDDHRLLHVYYKGCVVYLDFSLIKKYDTGLRYSVLKPV